MSRRALGETLLRISRWFERVSVFFARIGARLIYPKEFREALWRLEKKRMMRDLPFGCPPD